MATTERFGAHRSAMAPSPHGRVVSRVGGTRSPTSVMAHFLADGTLDPAGEGGMVTTDIQPNVQEEVPRGRHRVPDGGIVVAGYSGFDATMALARYLPDGSLDPSFGTGGIVAASRPAGCTPSPSSRMGGSSWLVGTTSPTRPRTTRPAGGQVRA
ncbi:MAG: delta-60 repeat domain-containing protein [Chloroflexota bacterium]